MATLVSSNFLLHILQKLKAVPNFGNSKGQTLLTVSTDGTFTDFYKILGASQSYSFNLQFEAFMMTVYSKDFSGNRPCQCVKQKTPTLHRHG
jgi:hypothetical protein